MRVCAPHVRCAASPYIGRGGRWQVCVRARARECASVRGRNLVVSKACGSIISPSSLCRSQNLAVAYERKMVSRTVLHPIGERRRRTEAASSPSLMIACKFSFPRAVTNGKVTSATGRGNSTPKIPSCNRSNCSSSCFCFRLCASIAATCASYFRCSCGRRPEWARAQLAGVD